MENRFERIEDFIDSLERTELTDDQQALLLVGTSMATSVANNCSCDGNNCICHSNNCDCNSHWWC